ncbi:SIS domain-containing protein [Escherichia coli]
MKHYPTRTSDVNAGVAEASRLPESLAMILFALPDHPARQIKVVVLGIGKSGDIGKKIAQRLPLPAHRLFCSSGRALHGDLGIIESRDVMLFISYSGGAKELDLIIPRLEDNHRRCWR